MVNNLVNSKNKIKMVDDTVEEKIFFYHHIQKFQISNQLYL